MAEISWIKLKTTMFDDEKIRLIQSLPEADAILVIWIRLLVLAGKTNDDGLIYIQRNMPYTEEMLATLFNKQVSVIKLALITLQNFEMVDLSDDGLIAITNWEKHQNIEGMEKIREQNRLRKAKQREKQKLLSDVTGQSRDSHATDIDKELDIDIDKDIKDKEVTPPKKSKAKPVRHKYGEYQNVLLSDTDLNKVKTEFPNDWEERIERISEYCASTGKSYKNFLATIRNWAKRDNNSNQKSFTNKKTRTETLPEWVDKQQTFDLEAEKRKQQEQEAEIERQWKELQSGGVTDRT